MLLKYRDAAGQLKTFRLKTMTTAKAVTIGRAKEADISLDDPKASRINAAIRYWDDIFIVRDMKSNNGTYLNGQKIEVAKLSGNDVLKVGETEIHVSIEESSSSEVTPTSKPGA